MNDCENREPSNKLCLRCVRSCKQTARILMLDCPRFQPRPFKSEVHRFRQMDLFNGKKS